MSNSRKYALDFLTERIKFHAQTKRKIKKGKVNFYVLVDNGGAAGGAPELKAAFYEAFAQFSEENADKKAPMDPNVYRVLLLMPQIHDLLIPKEFWIADFQQLVEERHKWPGKDHKRNHHTQSPDNTDTTMYE